MQQFRVSLELAVVTLKVLGTFTVFYAKAAHRELGFQTTPLSKYPLELYSCDLY